MINLIISGRVGNDAKELENGCVFNIASTKKGFTTKDGKVIEDKTLWLSVFAHKNLSPHIKKGDSLAVYTDFIDTKIHDNKVYLSCRAISVEFMSNKTESTQQAHVNAPIDEQDMPF